MLNVFVEIFYMTLFMTTNPTTGMTVVARAPIDCLSGMYFGGTSAESVELFRLYVPILISFMAMWLVT